VRCARCDSPAFEAGSCSCWKDALSPAARVARMLVIIAQSDARIDRLEHERRQAARPSGDRVIKGRFACGHVTPRKVRTA